jgi:regulator of cell morphogenesis and NO signaling
MVATQNTIREIAIQQPSSLRVFERFGIDYCCGGSRPLAQACEEMSIDPQALLQALEQAAAAGGPAGRDWTKEPLEAICNHIVEKHHALIRTEVPRLQSLAQKVVSRHGAVHPELKEIQELVESLGEELLQHIQKEERMLFPLITELERGSGGGSRPHGCFGSIRNPIRVMLAEHDSSGSALERMRSLSRDFTPPENAFPTYRGFYQALSELKEDLHQHIHLENNILFPRAIEMEQG